MRRCIAGGFVLLWLLCACEAPLTPLAPAAKPSVHTASGVGSILVVGVTPDYPPFAYQKNGGLAGMDIALAQALADDWDATLQLQPMRFDDLLEALNKGRVDLAIAAFVPTAERRALAAFSAPYFTPKPALLCRGDKPQALTGVRVAVYSQSQYVNMMRELLAVPVEMPGWRAMAQAVKQGDADAACMDETLARVFEEEYGLTFVPMDTDAAFAQGVCVAAGKEQAGILALVDATLNGIGRAKLDAMMVDALLGMDDENTNHNDAVRVLNKG